MIPIVDGDVVAYLSCYNRFRKRYEKDGEIVEEILVTQSMNFTKEEDAHFLMSAWDNFNNAITEFTEYFFADFSLVAVKGEGNYRDRLYPYYKLNRRDSTNTARLFVPHIRKLAVLEELAVAAHEREADDLMRIWAEECRKVGEEYVIISIDKDLKCIPGRHYNPKTKEATEVSEIEAMRAFYAQLMMGDATDNIPGLPKYGPVTANNIVSKYNSEADLQRAVVKEYKHVHGDRWREMLLSNGKLLYIQKHENDYFTLKDWVTDTKMLVSMSPKKTGPSASPTSPAEQPKITPKKFTGSITGGRKADKEGKDNSNG